MHFFKVLMPGFRKELKLPTSVSEELKRHKSERVVLESRLGKWKIRMCRNLENDQIYLNQGWSEFVDRHALRIGDFLVFEHTRNLHFNVSVFGPSACEKEYDDDDDEEMDDNEDEDEEADEDDDEDDEDDDDDFDDEDEEADDDDEEEEEEEATKADNLTNPPKNTSIAKIIEEAENKKRCFVKTMVPNHATKLARVYIPKELRSRYGLGQQTSATLRDPKGRAWPVALTSDRLRICGLGWCDFYESKGLKDGDVCVFELKRRLVTPTTIFFDVQTFSAPL